MVNMDLDLQFWKMNDVKYFINTSKLEEIKNHLNDCSKDYIPFLDSYVDLDNYSEKIFSRAIRFEAYVESNLIGMIAMYVNPDALMGYITNVSVNSEYNGKGIGNKLMDQAKKYALHENLKFIELEVYKNNIKAINFYKKNGFDLYTSTDNTLNMKHILDRDYNREFQDTPDHKYAYNFDIDIMHPYMIKSFEPFFRGNDVLELGSFKGDFTKLLLPYFNDITCVEASDEALNIAKEKLGIKITTYNSLFENTVLPKKYNNIILTHVLEHIDQPEKLINKINNEWLSDDGCLFVVCPNANAPSRQIAVKMGLISHNTAITKDEKEHGHRITYTLDTLERDIINGGLRVIHRSGIFFKALANFQWDRLLNTDIISKEYLDGCYYLGQQYPDLCSSIMVICKKN